VDRGRVLLVLLFALLALATAPAVAQGDVARSQAAVLGGLASDTPAPHHDLRDRPVTARHALSTPDSWWVVCAPTAGG